MLFKLFASSAIKFSSLRKRAPATAAVPDPSTPLRIVHAGGFVECCYMAVPAAGIMEKYPRAVLARPDVFRRPWDSLIQPEEILIPGEKVYVVPRRTIRKLLQRIRRPAIHGLRSEGRLSEGQIESSMSGKPTAAPARTFQVLGLSIARPERKKLDKSINRRPAAAPRDQRRKTRVQMAGIWQPSLEAIDEASPVAAPSLRHEYFIRKMY